MSLFFPFKRESGCHNQLFGVYVQCLCDGHQLLVLVSSVTGQCVCRQRFGYLGIESRVLCLACAHLGPFPWQL